jgi:hypothetical protein
MERLAYLDHREEMQEAGTLEEWDKFLVWLLPSINE